MEGESNALISDRKLFHFFSSVNVQFCYNELIHLHRDFNQSPKKKESNQKKSSDEFSEAARLDRDERFAPFDDKESEDLLDYSVYDDQVNRSILRVLCDEENLPESNRNPKVNERWHDLIQ